MGYQARMTNRRIIAVAALLCLGAGIPAQADAPVVVELFTSQGCSSCPPADALLGELVNRDDVIALSLHVDYWDYLGWTDEFADPANTERQRGYARAAGSTMIYTPQMVIEGRDQIVGTKAMELAERIELHKQQPAPVTLAVARSGTDMLRITAERVGDVAGPMLVQLVRYSPEEVVEIRAGENAGKSVTYHNVVSSLEVVGEWSGDAALDMEASAAGDAPSVVIIQDGSSGPILAAARAE